MTEAVDKLMEAVAQKLNTHPNMNVRLRWNDSRDFLQADNDPDYWLGVCYSAYQKEVLTKDEMKDILLALRACGAKSDYFKQIVREILM